MAFRRKNLLPLPTLVIFVLLLLLLLPCAHAWVTPNKPSWTSATSRHSTVALNMADSAAEPTTFREAEVLGLRLMQEEDYQGALDGTFFLSFSCVCESALHIILMTFIFPAQITFCFDLA